MPDAGGATCRCQLDDRHQLGGRCIPLAGATSIFPNTAAQKTNANNFPANTPFGSILITGGGYSQTGNQVLLSGSVHPRERATRLA